MFDFKNSLSILSKRKHDSAKNNFKAELGIEEFKTGVLL